jgi:hypothetical protein
VGSKKGIIGVFSDSSVIVNTDSGNGLHQNRVKFGVGMAKKCGKKVKRKGK